MTRRWSHAQDHAALTSRQKTGCRKVARLRTNIFFIVPCFVYSLLAATIGCVRGTRRGIYEIVHQ